MLERILQLYKEKLDTSKENHWKVIIIISSVAVYCKNCVKNSKYNKMINCKITNYFRTLGISQKGQIPLLEEYPWNIINFVTILCTKTVHPHQDCNFEYFTIVMSILSPLATQSSSARDDVKRNRDEFPQWFMGFLPTAREGNVLHLSVCSRGQVGRQTPLLGGDSLDRDPPGQRPPWKEHWTRQEVTSYTPWYT